ncbi:alpha-glucosidase family protein [Paradevosia shaoguanensis]|uniref:Alpha-glucosidase family protein n=1 Tax=Paradevosia shaoguanensis TaxID=1335043 RepID=A0AA41UAG1_9HYPH|nr:alpha-glucosidase family protein [Paradevosia shaoguanensis]MCF1741544.1 alpha-glucosidase family protein [Paradevosia shaoguanensis]MCI0126027.1 alpha-glucosidase family protein [Paradevosia shaoguanensis]
MREWWRGAVIYQVYPRSFQDTNGDGVGDLPGIMRRLDHIASLGVDAIWLSPIFQSPQADMGYDVSDYIEVDRLFGTMEDFDALIERAHALGLKVIIDQVLSHTSDQHPWFRESRLNRTNARADWFVWADPMKDGSPPNNWPSVFGGRAWEWNPSRGQYYFHNFLIEQPDLNFHNPKVQDAVLDVMRFWLERGVDGFRLDTVNYYFHDAQLRSNPPARRPEHLPYAVNPYDMQEHRYSKSQPENVEFLRKVRKLLDRYPNTTSVGEVGDSHKAVPLMAEYTSGGDKLHMCYSFEFLGDGFTAEHFRSRIETFFKASKDGWPCWSFSNHDVNRHMSRWAKHSQNPAELGRQAVALLTSFKGSVCIYQGEELGLPEADILYEELTDPPGKRFWPEYKGRDGCRTPMPWDEGEAPNGFSDGKPWLPVKPEHSALNVTRQNGDEASLLNFYRQLIAWRKQQDALVSGDITFFKTAEPILAFRRKSEDGDVVCIFNLSPNALNVTVRGASVGPDEISQNAEFDREQLSLGPNGFAYFLAGAGIDVGYAG